MNPSRWVVPILIAVLAAALAPAAETDDVDPVASFLDSGAEDVWAHRWLEGLCDGIGPRLSGSDAYDAAADYAATTFRDAGFDRVWTEPVTVPHWVRGDERAALTAPVEQELTILGLGGSVATPPEGIEAEVLAVTSFDELEARSAEAEGRIVVFAVPWEGYGRTVQYRTRGAVEAARHGALAALVRSTTGTSLATPHTGVMRSEEGVPRIPAASLTVEDAERILRLSRRGVPVRVRLEMSAETLPDRVQQTVLAEVRGRELPDEIVAVGCHLDSWDVGTGAHDDGAGCAIMAGAARLMLADGLRPRRTVRVVLYASEEWGGHAGEAYLEAHRDELDRHVAALESDSGCFAPDGFSVRAGDHVLGRLARMATHLAPVGASRVRPGWAGVDIGPIVEAGVPGIGHRTENERYFDYHHSPADTFDKIDPADLAANVAAVAGLVWQIAEEGLPQAEDAGGTNR